MNIEHNIMNKHHIEYTILSQLRGIKLLYSRVYQAKAECKAQSSVIGSEHVPSEKIYPKRRFKNITFGSNNTACSITHDCWTLGRSKKKKKTKRCVVACAVVDVSLSRALPDARNTTMVRSKPSDGWIRWGERRRREKKRWRNKCYFSWRLVFWSMKQKKQENMRRKPLRTTDCCVSIFSGSETW